MTRDGAAAPKVSVLFDPEPETWGLRGDPQVWRDLRERLSGTDLPASAGEVGGVLHAAFAELVGLDLDRDPAPSVYREQYAHGGMSSGMICLDTLAGAADAHAGGTCGGVFAVVIRQRPAMAGLNQE